MKRSYRVLLINAALLGCSEGATVAAKIPLIAVDAIEVDLGEFAIGDKKVPLAIFSITNKGEADLEVGPLSVNCGCATAEFAKGPLAPNESRPLKVSLKPATKHGPLTASLTVASNDPVRSELHLRVKWAI